MGRRFYSVRRLSLAQQDLAMQSIFPNFVARRLKDGMVWIGQLSPLGRAGIYKVKVKYSLHRRPRVWVLDPPLMKRSDDEEIPHLYSDGSVCLYLPWNNEWNRDLLIARTIVPWISLYLYFYEVWHITGEWMGGGQHPGSHDPDDEVG